ncbi:hypothetical protein BGX26_000086 [Mortierella sp. AD094]|nr:hypothetical protein BGX26_000086 [Mortierella sp. AD094]
MSQSSTDATSSSLITISKEELVVLINQEVRKSSKQQLEEIDKLKALLSVDDPHITTAARSTTLKPYDELAAVYPPIIPHNFYFSRVDEAETPPYTMSDFHYTEWMDYHSPPLADFDAAKSMSTAAKTTDRELAIIQGKLAHITRPLDTYAHETVKRKGHHDDEGKKGLTTTANVRLMLGDLAAQISATRKRLNLAELNIHLPATKESNPIITTEEAAEAKRHFESLNAAATPFQHNMAELKHSSREINSCAPNERASCSLS